MYHHKQVSQHICFALVNACTQYKIVVTLTYNTNRYTCVRVDNRSFALAHVCWDPHVDSMIDAIWVSGCIYMHLHFGWITITCTLQ